MFPATEILKGFLMNKDSDLSDFEPCERANCGDGSEFDNNFGVLSLQDCSEIFKSLKHSGKMHELVKPLETLTEKMCQQYQDNTLSMKDASIIVQSIMQHGFITLEYGVSNPENSNGDLTPWYEGNHTKNPTTLHKDSFRLKECHSHNGDNYDGEISTEYGAIYMKNSIDGAQSLNYSMVQEIECGGVETSGYNIAVIHSGLTPFKHSECGETLIQYDNLETPVLTNSKIRQHECKECGRTFKRKGQLRSHTMLIHSDARLLDCKECGKTFTGKESLKTHMMIHSGVRQHEMKECCKKFAQKGMDLKTHMLIHSGGRQHECKECGKTFTEKGNLKTHMLIHSGGRQHECKECGKTFTKEGSLKRHMVIHSIVTQHESKECGQTFTEKGNFKTHKLIHSGVRAHECTKCGLNTYMRIHSGVRQHESKQCGKTFTEKESLKTHMWSVSCVRQHEMKECCKKFTQKGMNLKRHMLIHSGGRPHECKECGKTFKKKRKLKRHMLIHSGVNQHEFKELSNVHTEVQF